MITKADFVAGKSFDYSGHFQRFANNTIRHQGGQIITSDKEFAWPVLSYNDAGFVVFNIPFGRIPVDFSECKLLTQPHTIEPITTP